jgi:hypothetical protein
MTGAGCRAPLSTANTHGFCEEAHGNIYIHHTAHANSDSLDTMVVFES